MDLCTRIESLQEHRDRTPGLVALVPTMGALHEGHLSLIDVARERVGPAGTVIVSLFVNPTQFGPGEDLERYPRPFETDAAACRERGVDLLFAPAADEMYPPDHSTLVRESALSTGLCGGARPGHFDGVCTIVLKLLLLTRPHLAVFGRKDYQQLAVVRRMVRDLNVPVKIVPAATVREADGLALSSRNRYLNPAERAQAPALNHALRQAKSAFEQGETNGTSLLATAADVISRQVPDAKIDYLQLVHRDHLQPMPVATRDSVLLGAMWLGTTRLIDNLELADEDSAATGPSAAPASPTLPG